MNHWITPLRGILLVLAALCLRVPAADPLTSIQYEIVGTQLRVSPASLTVPKGVPGSIRVELASLESTNSSLNSASLVGAHVEAILRGPSFPSRRLVSRPGDPLLLPALNQVGDYQLDSIRLVDSTSGRTRLVGTPSSIPVHVFDQVLVSKVTTRPLSMQEITDKGIVIDANNFRAVEFEVGFVLDGAVIPVKFPVVAPDFKQSTEIIPNAEIQKRLVEAQQVNDALARQWMDSGEMPAELQRPGLNIQIKGIHFERATATDRTLGLGVPPIPALLVIPGNIGYLNQFFSVQIFTENGAPSGSGLSVHNVRAQLHLPAGPDGIVSTNYAEPGDDPLRFARVGSTATVQRELPILGPPPTSHSRFQPGMGGSAEFLVEGLQEGLHLLELDLTAQLDGLAAGSIAIQGKAAGSVLVRNPKFSMSFAHPKTVRSGEPYLARVTLLNTSSTMANQVSVTLRGASLSGGVLETPETVALGDIPPGQSATATYRVRAQRTGSIRFSNLTTGDASVQGRFQLTLGIDEREVELSPDSIGYPPEFSLLPDSIQSAANRVLGQALSAATAPLLPAGVKPVGRSILTRRVLELAEAGQRLRLGDSLQRVLLDVMLDWQGGRVDDEGFSQILRTTNAGNEFREALASTLESVDPQGAATRLEHAVTTLAGRGESWFFVATDHPALDIESSRGGLKATRETNALERTAFYRANLGTVFAERLPSASILRLRPRFDIPQFTLSAWQLRADGTGTQMKWTRTNALATECFEFDSTHPERGLTADAGCDGQGLVEVAPEILSFSELPAEVIAVHQDTELSLARPFRRCSGGPANNYGNVLAILFSKPMSQAQANLPSAYQLDNGVRAAGVQIQPGGRVALVSLQEAISAIRPRTLSIQGVRDARGNLFSTPPRPVQTQFKDGVAIHGRVLRADGSVAVGVPVTVTYYDPWKDPFDRCDPIVTTRIAQKYTDANGFFTFDFIHGGVGFTVAAVDTGGLDPATIQTILQSTVGDRFASEKLAALAAATNALAQLGASSIQDAARFIEGLDRAVWNDSIALDSGRIGHELQIGLRFRGRGIVLGRVLGPDGETPIPNAAVNLFPDPDSRELARGVFTDAQGDFEFHGVPLGVFNVQVKSGFGHFRTVSGALGSIRETNRLEIVLTAPESKEILRTRLAGRVVEPGTLEPHPRARVFLTHVDFGLVASAQSDDAGTWVVEDLPVGRYQVRAFSEDGRRGGLGNGEAVLAHTAFISATLEGVGTVIGRVETSTQQPVANAVVAGGESLVTTDANGLFRLTGVPLGRRAISAGLESHLSPDGFPRLGSVAVDVLPGLDNFVVVRLRPSGVIIGRVLDANGAIQPNIKVAIPMPPEGFAWVETDGLGRFTFPNMALGDYTVSAPAPPVLEDPEAILRAAMDRSEEEVLAAIQRAANSVQTLIVRRYGDTPLVPAGSFGFNRVVLENDGQVVEANIQFLPTGTASGMVINDQGTPIGARVRLTGLGLNEIGQPISTIIGDRDSDPATGTFTIPRLPAGAWALQAANPFFPRVIVTNGLSSRDNLNPSNVVLQFPPRGEIAGRLIGVVETPDGTPAGKGVRVRINLSDDYEVRTDENGRFDTQLNIPARQYTVEALDDITGLRGTAQAGVTAGQTNSVRVRLLGKGSLWVQVYRADGTPAPGASVRVDQNSYPNDSVTAVTDANGEARLENLFEGRYTTHIRLTTGASLLERRAGIEVTRGDTARQELTLGPTGTLRGIYRRSSDGTPIAFARINVGNAAFPTSDSQGRFEVSGLKLGHFVVFARDPVSGKLARATATLTFDNQVLDLSLLELSQGELSGVVLQEGEATPIAGAEIRLTPRDSLSPSRTVTSGPDGRFSFPAVTPGLHSVSVQKSYGPGDSYQTSLSTEFPENSDRKSIELILPKRTVLGRVTVEVLDQDGSAIGPNATVNGRGTDNQGQVVFDGVRLGNFQAFARSLRASDSSSATMITGTLTELRTNLVLTARLSGVGRVNGKVTTDANGTPAPGIQVQLTAQGQISSVSRSATVLTAPDGSFEFGNLPLGNYTLLAIQAGLASKVSGTIRVANQLDQTILQLGPSGGLTGRLLRADGTQAVTNIPVFLDFVSQTGVPGTTETRTDTDGRFEFESIPVGPVTFRTVVQAVSGISRATALIPANSSADLGDILLDESWPEVVQTAPEPGSTGVGIRTPIQIHFSEPIATNSIHADGIYLRSADQRIPSDLAPGPVVGTSTRSILLTPREPLRSQTLYRLTVLNGDLEDGLGGVIGRGPRDMVGRPLLAAFGSTFVTRDDDPPKVVSSFPTNHAVQVSLSPTFRLSFSEPIQESGIEAVLTGPNGTETVHSSLGLGATVLALQPISNLRTNTTYQLSVGGIRDLQGNALAGQPFQVEFDTLDLAGPVLKSIGLARQQPAVAGARVEIEALPLVEEPGMTVRFTADGVPIAASIPSPFRAGWTLPTTGTVVLRAIATDRFGNDGPLAEHRVVIVPNEPPSVTLLRGAPGNAPAPTGSRVAVTVGATDDVGITNLLVVISGATNAVHRFPEGTTRALEWLIPSDAVAPGFVEVRAVATDALGAISTESLVRWEMVDGTQPTLSLLAPDAGAAQSPDVPLALRLRVRDNSSRLRIEVETEGALESTHPFPTAIEPNRDTEIELSVPLKGADRNGANLAITVRVLDDAGNLVKVTRQLRLLDIQPPTLVQVQPTNGATRVPLWDVVRHFTFSEPLGAGSLDTNHFKTQTTGTPMASAVLSTFGDIVRLVLASPLQPGLTYTNSLEPDIADRAGNTWVDSNHQPFASALEQTFTTAAIHSILPTNGTPVFGGDKLPVQLTFDPELGARFFRFRLNEGPVLERSIPAGATSVGTEIQIPLDTPTLVVSIEASDTAAFNRPLILPSRVLRFEGNRTTNQPPVVRLTRVSPATGSLALGSTLGLTLAATDDFGIARLELSARGPVTTNWTFATGQTVSIRIPIPTNANPEIPLQMIANAVDTQGSESRVQLEIPLLAMRFPFALGTVFYSRDPAPNGTIWALEPNGHAELQITSGSYPRLSGDGRYLAFQRGTQAGLHRGDLYVRDLATGDERRVVPDTGVAVVGFDWLKGTNRLLFDQDSILDQINADGTGRTRFSGVHSWDDSPSVNQRDGRVVIHNLVGGTISGLYWFSSDASIRRRIPNTVHGDSYPVWSPDGEWIAFLNAGQLLKIRPDGYDRTALTETAQAGETFVALPAWSNEGRHVIAAGVVKGTNALWSIDTETRERTLRHTEDGVDFETLGDVHGELLDGPLPEFVGSDPVNAAEKVSLWNTNILLRFNRAIAPASVQPDAVRFSAIGAALTSEGSRIRIQPTLPLTPDTLYSVETSGTLTDLVGRTLPPGRTEFRTANLLLRTPTHGFVIRGGQWMDVELQADPELGARHYELRLNQGNPVRIEVPLGATTVRSRVLVPLSVQDSTLEVLASPDASFSNAFHLPPVHLVSGGNSGTNRPPAVLLEWTQTVAEPVQPGESFGVRLQATSDFGIDHVTVFVEGAWSESRTLQHGGPAGLTFVVPDTGLVGGMIRIRAEAVDRLGVLRATPAIERLVSPATPPLPSGTIFYTRIDANGTNVWSMTRDGTSKRAQAPGWDPRVSPDGRYLLVGRDKSSLPEKNVYLIDLLTGQERLLFAHTDRVNFYDWTPDSTRILFDFNCEFDWTDLDGMVVRAASIDCTDDAPSIQRVDGRVAFHSRDGLWIAAPDLSGRTRVPNTRAGDTWAQWSFQGQWLSFIRAGNVFRIRPNGEGLLQLTDFGVGQLESGPAVWLDDDLSLVVAATVQGTNGLYQIAAEGGHDPELLKHEPNAFIRSVGSVAHPVKPPVPFQLLSSSPVDGALQVPLWPGSLDFRFSEALAPESVQPTRFQLLDPQGNSVPFTVAPQGNVLRIQPAEALRPGTTYRRVLLPGLQSVSGAELTLPNGLPIPVSGWVTPLSTADLISINPTNGTPVNAGETIALSIDFDPELGARWFRFRLNEEPFQVQPIPPGTGRIQAQAHIGSLLEVAHLEFQLADDEAFSKALVIAQRSLALTPLGNALSLELPTSITLRRGAQTNLLALARSTNAPIANLEWDLSQPVPSFVSLGPVQITNGPTSGSAGLSFSIDATFAPAGSITLPWIARTQNGTEVRRAIQLHVEDDPSFAVTRWKDAVNGTWGDASKWTAGVPGPALPAVIDVPGTYTVTLTTDARVGNLYLGATSGRPQLALNSRVLQLERHAVIGTNGLLRINGVLRGPGSLNCKGSIEMNSGSVESGGALAVLPGATLSFISTLDKTFLRPLVNWGLVEWSGGRIFLQGGGQSGWIENMPSGVIDVSADARAQSGTFVNRGRISKTQGNSSPNAATTIGSTFTNLGNLEVLQGNLDLAGPVQNSGTLTVAIHSTVTFSQSLHRHDERSVIQGEGSVVIGAGATFEFAGDWALQGALTATGTARFFNPTGVRLRTLRLLGALDGPSPIAISDQFEWISGELRPGGALTLEPGAIALLSSNFDRGLYRWVRNSGEWRWDAGRIFAQSGVRFGTLHNLPQGVVSVRSSDPWFNGSILNEGRILKIAPADTAIPTLSILGATVENDGQVTIDSGTLVLNNSSQMAGRVAIATNATLALIRGTHEFLAGSEITGRGTIDVDGGTMNLNGTWNSSGKLRVASLFRATSPVPVRIDHLTFDTGRIHGPTPIHVGNTLEWNAGTLESDALLQIESDAVAIWKLNDKTVLGTVNNAGRVEWQSGNLFGAGLIHNQPTGMLELQGDNTLFTAMVRNDGVLAKSNSEGTSVVSGDFHNRGSVLLNSGNLALRGKGHHQGSFTVGPDSSLVLGRSFQSFAKGSIVVGPGTLVTEAGLDLRFGAGSWVDVDCAFEAGAIRFDLGSRLQVSQRHLRVGGSLQLSTGNPIPMRSLRLAGTLGGSDDVLVADELEWVGGTMRDTGTTQVSPGAHLALGVNDRTLNRRLTVSGTAAWSAGRFFCDANGQWVITPTGILSIRGNAEFFNGTLENQGRVLRETGEGSVLITSTWLNRGRLDLHSGLWRVSGSSTNSGILHLATGSSYLSDGPTITFAPGTQLDGTGTLRFSGSTRVILQTPVDFGTLIVRFEGQSTLAGIFPISNQPGGLLVLDHSMEIPGSMTIGGTLRIPNASTRVTLQGILTLLNSGTLDNAGTLRVGQWVRENGQGGTVIGNEPVVIGQPSQNVAPLILELRFGATALQADATTRGDSSASVEIVWRGADQTQFIVECSHDLQHWEAQSATVERLQPGLYRARLPDDGAPNMFVRVRENPATH